jgi:uncharacterized protein
MHAEGLGTAKNLTEAIRLYEAAGNAGDFFAQIELGRIYSRGAGLPPNLEAAMKWYSAAAAQESSVDAREELREAKAYVARRS